MNDILQKKRSLNKMKSFYNLLIFWTITIKYVLFLYLSPEEVTNLSGGGYILIIIEIYLIFLNYNFKTNVVVIKKYFKHV